MTRIITDSHVAATVRIAANIIEQHGWCQGNFTARPDGRGRHRCLMAAIAEAAGGTADDWELRPETPDERFLHGLMQRTAVEVGVHVGVFRPSQIPFEADLVERLGNDWNDDPERTADQVVRALRRTADGLEAAA